MLSRAALARPVVLLAVVAFAAHAPGARADEAASGGDRQFIDASSNNFPPVNLLDDRQALTGFGAELAGAVIGAVGGTVGHIHSPVWTDVLAWLDSGEADFIHDTGYTPERTSFLDYSEPILRMPEEIFVLSDRYDIHTLESLFGKRVACVNEHITHLYLQRFPDIVCQVVATPRAGVQALLAGEVDAFIYPRQIVLYYAYQLDVAERIKSVGEPLRTLTWHMVVKKGNTEMLLLLNRGIARVKASGEYDRIYDKWFGRAIGGYSGWNIALIMGAVLFAALLCGGGFLLWTRTLRATVARQTAALRTSEARLSDFAEGASDWFWEMGPDLCFTYFSERYFEITGLRPADQIGKRRTNSDGSPGDATSDKRWAAHHADLEARRPFKDFEYTFTAASGRPCHVRVSGVPVFAEDGEFLGYRGTGSDITESKRAEDALRLSEMRLSKILEIAPEAIVSIDENQTIIMFNQGAQTIFGYSPDEIIGSPLERLIPDHFRGAHREHIGQFARSPETNRVLMSQRGEIAGLRKDGGEFPAEASISKLDVAGQKIFTVSLRDISERKQAEEDLRHAQKMEAVGQLTGGVAHDFNNLLAAVLGHAQLLEDRLGADNPSLQVLIRTVDRGAELTHRLLAFSRRQTLKPTSIDVDALVDDVNGLIRRTLPESIDIQTTGESTLWPCTADQAQLENAVLNLALNARDAMPGGGTLTITTTNVAINGERAAMLEDVSPGDYVKLSVSDTGTGMPPEIVERVFEPFFTTKDVGQGSGLGLSMVYGFAKQSGGHVAVSSEVGKGTTMDLFLPRADRAVDSVQEPTVMEAPPGHNEIILVVEDEDVVREIIARSLRMLGYNAIEAKDGKQAMAALIRNPKVDLLLTDVVLPGGMSGPDVAEKVRRHSPGIKSLFISGYPLRAMANEPQLPDDAELLNKPFSRHQLAIKVRAVLDSRAA